MTATPSPYAPTVPLVAGEFDKVIVTTEDDYTVTTATVTVWAENGPAATSKALTLIERKLARLGLINCLERTEGRAHGEGIYTIAAN